MVPEANDAITAALEKRRPFSILVNPIDMLSAVKLDDELAFETTKVDDITTDWYLPAKLQAAERAGT
jgi:hypothetical protein